MGIDYYKILRVSKEASSDELYKAYGKLYKKWDPEKNRDNKREAFIMLKLTCEAIEVLSDPQKRTVYDQYREEGLKGRVPPPDAGGPSGATGGGPTSFRFNPRSPDDIFSNFFGQYGEEVVPLPDAGGPNGATGRSPEDIFSDFFGVSSPSLRETGGSGGMRGSRFGGTFDDSMFASFGEGGGSGPGGSMHQPPLRKASPIEHNLPCTLEELYKGTAKKIKISREVVDPESGKKMTVKENLTVNVKPGWKKGTKITFPRKGNELPGVEPADVVFVIDEKPHGVFIRDDNDLVVTQMVSQNEALSGYAVHITTLDGRNLTVPVKNAIHPTHEEVVQGEGMPLPKDPSKRGNLRIRFYFKF